MKEKKHDCYLEEYQKLVGRTVVSVGKNASAGEPPIYGLHFTGGCYATIQADEEGNGPGFLDIYIATPLTKEEKECISTTGKLPTPKS